MWTVTSTSQAADSSPKDDFLEEEDVSAEVESEENLEEEKVPSDNDKGFTHSHDDVVDMLLIVTCHN